MNVQQVAERVGLPARRVRYYDAQGLVSPPRQAANGYRAYTPSDIDELRLVARARTVGLSLDDCRRLVGGWRTGSKGWRHETDYTLRRAEAACTSLREIG